MSRTVVKILSEIDGWKMALLDDGSTVFAAPPGADSADCPVIELIQAAETAGPESPSGVDSN